MKHFHFFAKCETDLVFIFCCVAIFMALPQMISLFVVVILSIYDAIEALFRAIFRRDKGSK